MYVLKNLSNPGTVFHNVTDPSIGRVVFITRFEKMNKADVRKMAYTMETDEPNQGPKETDEPKQGPEWHSFFRAVKHVKTNHRKLYYIK